MDNARKRHIVVDNEGRIIGAAVHEADPGSRGHKIDFSDPSD